MTTARYMLPGQLEPEVEILGDQNPKVVPPNLVWVRHPELGVVQLDRTRLTEVKPPLPLEPSADSVVLDRDGDAWQRDPSGPEGPDGERWVGTASPVRLTWERLNNRYGPLRRLVPDPADDAPELPWTLGTHKDRIAATYNGLVWIFLEPGYHSPEEARLRAAAILRAAREVERP